MPGVEGARRDQGFARRQARLTAGSDSGEFAPPEPLQSLRVEPIAAIEGPWNSSSRNSAIATYTSFPVVAARLLLATIFGAAIGFEREWRNRPAGLRTHILVCVAAATFAILTIEIIHAPMFTTDALGDAVKVDPIRIVEAVTAGVAFLAAGVVIFTRGQVHGLTTGAGMWLAGAIGVACGLGPLADRAVRHAAGAGGAGAALCLREQDGHEPGRGFRRGAKRTKRANAPPRPRATSRRRPSLRDS